MHRSRRSLALTAALASSLATPALAGRPVEAIQADLDANNYMPREILVQYRAVADSWVRGEARSQVAAERLETVLAGSKRQDGKGDLELVRVPPGPGLAAAIARLEQDPAVEFAEANWIYFHQATSNDTYVTNGSLWGMYSATATGGGSANPFGSGATTAWQNNKTNCGSVYVGIIDEGYMYTHTEFGFGTAASNVGTNPGEIAGNSKDDDGNGYVDDVYGWDFDGNNSSVFDGVGDDHGTHV
ncbi:MAG: S8 family serine peptidase, partial [Gammaproteobacteria bacterium]